jgi:hypothetical protein
VQGGLYTFGFGVHLWNISEQLHLHDAIVEPWQILAALRQSGILVGYTDAPFFHM